jgi:hypothetical protein
LRLSASGSPEIINITAYGNSASEGGALYTSGTNNFPFIRNSVLWGNTSSGNSNQQQVFVASGQPLIENSLIQDGVPAGAFDNGGNLSSDPLFVDADGADDTAGTADDDLRLGSASPAIDAGDSSLLPQDVLDIDDNGDTSEELPLDLAGNVRRQDVNGTGFVVDMGAYEAAGVPLPVELAAFTAVAEDGNVLLSWTTASETNNAGFAVEQRTVAESGPEGVWREVGFVEGAGTTSEAQSYRLRIPAVGPGTHTFRLRQIDLDGTEAITDPVEVSLRLDEAYALAAYPNPFGAGRPAHIRLDVREAQRVQVAVYDVLGRRVATLHDGEVASKATMQLAGQGLASGVYFVRVTGEHFQTTRRLTLVR